MIEHNYFRFIVIIFSISFSFSCTSKPSSHVYIERNLLSRFNTVAVTVATEQLDIRFERESSVSGVTALSLALFGLVGLLVGGSESGYESLTDNELATNVRQNCGKYSFDKLLGDYFIKELRAANMFKIYYSDTSNFQTLAKEGFNASIELKIDQLSLVKATYLVDDSNLLIDDSKLSLRIYMKVSGKMVDLINENVIWYQSKEVISDEEFTVDEYKAEGCHILKEQLDRIINKIAFRLASDFVYSK